MGVCSESLLATEEGRTQYLMYMRKVMHTEASIADMFHATVLGGVRNAVLGPIPGYTLHAARRTNHNQMLYVRLGSW